METPLPLAAPQGMSLSPTADQWVAVVDDAGERLVLVNEWGGWIFLRLVDVATSQVVKRISLKPPAPVETPIDACWSGDWVSVAGTAGGYFEIDPERGEVRAWREIRDLMRGNQELRGTLALGGDAPLWVVTREPWRRPGGRGRGSATCGTARHYQLSGTVRLPRHCLTFIKTGLSGSLTGLSPTANCRSKLGSKASTIDDPP